MFRTLILLMFLASCAQAPAGKALIQAPCQYTSTAATYAACVNAYERRIYASHPYQDLLGLRLAYRSALAERVDKGQITRAQYDLRMAQVINQIDNEIRTRNALNRQARQQRSYQNVLIGLSLLNTGHQPTPAITCQPWADGFRCF